MTKYTVVGIYDDNDQCFVDWVEAMSLEQAIDAASRTATAPLHVVAVFEGHHKDLGAWTYALPVLA